MEMGSGLCTMQQQQQEAEWMTVADAVGRSSSRAIRRPSTGSDGHSRSGPPVISRTKWPIDSRDGVGGVGCHAVGWLLDIGGLKEWRLSIGGGERRTMLLLAITTHHRFAPIPLPTRLVNCAHSLEKRAAGVARE